MNYIPKILTDSFFVPDRQPTIQELMPYTSEWANTITQTKAFKLKEGKLRYTPRSS